MDSRFRGNDDSKVMPAKAGIHAALAEYECGAPGICRLTQIARMCAAGWNGLR